MTTSGGGGSSGGSSAGSSGGSSGSAGSSSDGAQSGGSAASGTTADGGAAPADDGGAPHGAAGRGAAAHASTEEVAGILEGAGTRWSAATVGVGAAEDLQRASNTPVMAVGSRVGGDSGPSLSQFQRYVADGQVHYFVTGASNGGAGRSGDGAAQVERWVADNYDGEEVGGLTVYDLSKPPTGKPPNAG